MLTCSFTALRRTTLAGAVPLLGALVVAACGGADSAFTEEPTDECPEVVRDGGGGIPDPPNGAGLCPPGVCNYQTQEGCASGEACRPQYPAGSTQVAPGCEPAGTGLGGDPCEDSTDCAPGYLCFDPAGVCRKLCCGRDWSACDPGESCIRQFHVRFGDRIEYAADVCFPVGTCDVFDPTSCEDESTDVERECKIVDPTGAVACMPSSEARLGEPCGPSRACIQGLLCVGGACRKLCRAEACGEPSCGPGEGTCVHFDRDPPGVGECTPGW